MKVSSFVIWIYVILKVVFILRNTVHFINQNLHVNLKYLTHLAELIGQEANL